jgi:hypothetical protein
VQKNQSRETPKISMHLTNNWTNSGAKHTEHIYNHDVRFGFRKYLLRNKNP